MCVLGRVSNANVSYLIFLAAIEKKEYSSPKEFKSIRDIHFSAHTLEQKQYISFWGGEKLIRAEDVVCCYIYVWCQR